MTNTNENKITKLDYVRYLNEILEGILYVLNPEDGNPKTRVFYIYKDGIFKNRGEDYIRTLLREFDPTISKHMVEEVVDNIRYDKKYRRDRVEFNRDINLINIQNGVYNLESKDFLPHNPMYNQTTILPPYYDPQLKYKGSKVEQFMLDITCSNMKKIKLIQEMFGYCLYKDYSIQKAFLLVGEGANGKSTLLQLLSRMLGRDNISNVSIEEITSGGRFVAYKLYTKMANISSELENKMLKNTTVFKMATGGDKLTHERKFRDSFEFYNYAKLIFAINEVPQVKDETTAFYRRWIPIEFDRIFMGKECDVNILDKLSTPTELAILLNWAIAGLHRLLDNNSFSDTWGTDMVRGWWNRQTERIYLFLVEHYDFDQEESVLKEDLYEHYKEWSLQDRYVVECENGFSRKLKKLFGGKIVSHQHTDESKRYWKGIVAKPTIHL